MKNLGKVIVFALLMAVIIAGFSSCGLKKSVEITNVGWVIENIDRNYWSNPPASTNLAIRFFVNYAFTNCDESALESIRVTAPNGVWWEFELEPNNIEYDDDVIIFALIDSSDNYSTMPIGEYDFVLSAGGCSDSSYSRIVPAPASTSVAGKTTVYNENFAGTVTGSHVQTLRRPTLGTHAIDADSASIQFSTTSTIAFSGWVQFYSSSGTYIGLSPKFLAYGTGAFANFLNYGTPILYTNGTMNMVDVPFADIDFLTGYSSSDISRFALCLTDGGQYVGTNGTYDCISFTSRTSF